MTSDSRISSEGSESNSESQGNPQTPKKSGAAKYPVVEEAYQFVLWVTQTVENLPKAHKFTIGDRLQTKALDLVDVLVEAAYTRHRVPILRRANLALEQMRFLIRLCMDRKLLDFRRYEFAAKSLDSIGRSVGGWMKASDAQASRRSLRSNRQLSSPAPGGEKGDAGQAQEAGRERFPVQS